MVLLFLLNFRIFQPKNDQKSIFLPREIQVITCESRQNENFENFEFHTINLFHCETEGTEITISKCIFKNIKLYFTSSGVRSDYSFLTRFKFVNIDINNCEFDNVTYMDRMISSEVTTDGLDRDDIFSFYSNSISNCYDIEKERNSVVVFTQYKINDIKYNNVLFQNIEHNTRAFQLKYHRGSQIIGNEIKNSFYEEGSAFLFMLSGFSPNHLVFSDCVFSNCNGGIASSVVIHLLDYEITLTNLTYENCKNEYYGDLQEGYFTFLDFNCTDAKANFIDCTFSYLESNCLNGGGIGLLILNSDKYTITFENSTFEHLIHTNSTIGGGAIQISPIYPSNTFTDLIIKSCTFTNVTSNGFGGAIYYDSATCYISISDCTFENAFSDNGHAIYIHMNSSLKANIFNCNFIDCCSKNDKNTFMIILDSFFFDFSYNEISFSDLEQSCKIINSSLLNYHCYNDNLFKNIKNSEEFESPIINEISNDETITIIIENNTFDCINSHCQGRCINVNIMNPSLLKLLNNSIINCPVGSFYLKISFQSEITSFDIELFKFINNEISINLMTEFYSCPQVLIQNKIINDKPGVFDLNFINCYFENNKSPDNGGAIQYGKNDQTIKTKVFIKNCQFIGNKAANNGGAIAILTYQGGQIENCYFSKNIAENGGNSIYIENEFTCTDCNSQNIEPEIVIDSCLFSENGENNENSIITACNASNVPIIIKNSNFTNPKTNGYVISFPNKILSMFIANCNIESTNTNGGGISIISSGKIDIKSVSFKSIKVKSALRIDSNERNEEINIVDNTFDSCSGIDICFGFNCICFGIELITTLFSFENNTISQTKVAESNHYIGIINCNGYLDLKMINDTFINNSCSSLYGGGVGLYVVNIPKLELSNCTFIGNNAIQNKDVSRPIESNDYYNGDGGGIQLGFVCSSSGYDVVFDQCVFENNRAQRHGGAIALQTQATVQIIDCSFINNVANFNFDSLSSSLLFENYFNLKSSGKGGAIYINPAYEIGNCIQTGDHMTNVKIENSNFLSNSASDGHAIFIEGDDPGTIFEIQKNSFIDNYNQTKIGINGAVISSEIYLNPENVINKNTFKYNESDINVRPIHFVDHYGIFKTDEFSSSIFFTDSYDFTNSMRFSNSFVFSLSMKFTKSQFFDRTDDFSKSGEFTKSQFFDRIDDFSKSIEFTKSQVFDKTDDFSKSKEFTKSQVFDKTDDFSNSKEFTKSKEFELTNIFTSSNAFSSIQESIKTDYFLSTSNFTVSSKFTESYSFSDSKLYNSIHESNSNLITLSLSFSISFVRKKSVSYSYTLFASNSFIMSYDPNIGTYLIQETYSNYYHFLPYIIFYFSPTYVMTYFHLEIIIKHTITKEQLIGIACGSAAGFFLIIYIIIVVVRRTKMQYIKYDNSYAYSDSSISISSENENKCIEVNNIIDENLKNMDLWI